MKITRREWALAMAAQAPDPSAYKIPKKRGPRAKPNNQPEQVLQIACCKMLAMLPATLYWSTPNHLWLGKGASHGARMGYMAKQKAMGLLPGATDLVIIFRNSHGATAVVLPELKSEHNKPTDNQQAFADTANALGCYTGVVRSLDDLVAMLRAAGHRSFK